MATTTEKIIDSIERSWKNLFSFAGRTNRYDYFAFLLVIWGLGYIVTTIAGAIQFLIGEAGSFTSIVQGANTVWSLVILIPCVAITVRRLHDIGRSGWWLLISFTIVGILIVMYWTFKRSAPDNSYGELKNHPDAGLILMLCFIGLSTAEITLLIVAPYLFK
jgi:uncharacterized membrane protein YhaH (DUF805 family)